MNDKHQKFNAFFRHRSTYVDSHPPLQSSVVARCVEAAINPRLKEEIIPQTLENIDLYELFVRDPPWPYQYKRTELDRFKGMKIFDDPTVFEEFAHQADIHLDGVVRDAERAVSLLMDKIEAPRVREMLRITPLNKWSELAEIYG
jgi:hypothetical protein